MLSDRKIERFFAPLSLTLYYEGGIMMFKVYAKGTSGSKPGVGRTAGQKTSTVGRIAERVKRAAVNVGRKVRTIAGNIGGRR
jgi:hypothetical protein